MNHKIGVMCDSFRLGLRGGLKQSAAIGADGVQIYAVSGEMDPDNLSTLQRIELKEYIESLGLEVAALCGDLGGHGFQLAKDNPWKIAKSKKILNLALDLGCNVVTTHIGVVPEDSTCEKYKIMAKACEELGDYADSVGAYFAVETGPEPSARLRKFLDSLSSQGVRVNFDPANLVMVIGEDPVEAVANLAPYIVHTHAKDGIMVKKTDPQLLYDIFADGAAEDFSADDYFIEEVLGEGDVLWSEYLSALEKAGYTGYLTIEREAGDDPVADISLAINYLQGL